MVYKKGLEFNLENKSTTEDKMKGEDDVWYKRRIVATAFKKQIQNECKTYEGLVNRIVKDKVKRYFFALVFELSSKDTAKSARAVS